MALLVCACCQPAALADNGWQQMIDRDQPRAHQRSPEDVAAYIERGNGSYGQLNLTTVWQVADRSTTELDDLVNVAYDFSGGLEVGDGGLITWWLRGGRPVGSPRESDLAKAIGSSLGVNGSQIDDDLDLAELYWAQGPNRKLRVSLGLIDSSWRYDFNDTANSAKENFLSPALGNSGSVPFPDRSLAADLLWAVSPTIDLHAGLYQTNCSNQRTTCFEDLNSEEWFTPVELILRRPLGSWGSGSYRLLGFWTRKDENEGVGVSLNIEQPFGPVTAFARLSVADRQVADFRRFVSAGITVAEPLGRAHDALGFGWATGEPADKTKRTESIFELYWRLQLSPFFALSPNLQLVLNPADNPEEERVVVGGLRLQLDL